MRYRTQAIAYPYFVVALLLYGLQMVFGLLSIVKYLGPDPIVSMPAVRREQGNPHQPADRLGADRLHGRHLLGGARGIADRALLRPASPTGSSASGPSPGVTAVVGYLFRLDGGQQAAGAAPAGEDRHRGRDADVPLQHRHDDLDGEAAHHHRGRPGGGPRAWPRCSTCRRCSPSTTTPSASSTAGGRCTCGSRASGR